MLKSDPYDQTIVTMKWIRNYDRANRGIDRLISEVNTPKAQALIKKRLEDRPDGPFGEEWFSEVDPRKRHQFQVQLRYVGGSAWVAVAPDGLDAAFHGFYLYALAGGCKDSTGITVDRVGIYARDSFDFQDEQYLGYWEPPASVSPAVAIVTNNRGRPISNRSFRDYRDQTQMGGVSFGLSVT